MLTMGSELAIYADLVGPDSYQPASSGQNASKIAAGYINDLREQRITGYTDAASVTIDEILDERRKELFAEGHIAFDYWRNGKNVVKGSLTTAPTDTKTVLPIPKEEIDLAKGKLKQNPGYGN